MENYKEKSNYEVKFIDEKAYIKYKDREFETYIKDIRCKDGKFKIKDQNGEQPSFSLLVNMMLIAENKYNELIKDKLDKMKVLNKNEVVSKFKGVREAFEEEKEEYFNYIKRKNKSIDIISNVFGAFFFFIAFSMLIAAKENSLMIFVAIAFAMCGYFMRNSRITKAKLRKIIKGKLYISDCYSCELETRSTTEAGIYYYIKVTDDVGNYINEWFEIDKESLDNKGETAAKLYVVEYNGKYELNVATKRMLELGKI